MYYNATPEYLYTMMNKATRRRLSGTIGDVPFTGEDVAVGSFEATNRCAEGSSMKIGGVYIGELSLTFVPSFLNKVPRKKYIGQEIAVSIGLYVPDLNAWEDIPIGVYTVKSANISKDGISIEAVDNMQKFDSPFVYATPYGKPYDLLNAICQGFGVPLGVTRAQVEAFPNGNEELYLVEENDIETWRDVIYWIAQTLACFATINRAGELELRQFGNATTEFDARHRDVDCVYSDYVTKWTSISMDDNDAGETQYYSLVPNDGLNMALGNNPFLQTVADKDKQEAIAYLEGEIDKIDQQLDDIADAIEVLEQQLDIVEVQLREHPDDPVLLAEKARLESEIEAEHDNEEALANQREKLEKDIEDIESGIEQRSKVFKDRARKRILQAVAEIQFSPFAVNSARDPIFDLGDIIYFTGGIAQEVTSCVMAFSYKVDTYSFEGYGDNPDLTDARSGTDKSVTALSKKQEDKVNEVEFVQYINAAPVSVAKGQQQDVGRMHFQVGKTSDVEFWVELKLQTTLNDASQAGFELTYYLDGEEITAYHPVHEITDIGAKPEFELVGETLKFRSVSAAGETRIQTLNFHFHLTNISPKTVHIWRVKITGREGVEFIDTGCARMVLWAQGMAEPGEWIGLIEAKDVFPLYPIKGMSLFGSMADAATVTTEE